jgi:hypothetical protein
MSPAYRPPVRAVRLGTRQVGLMPRGADSLCASGNRFCCAPRHCEYNHAANWESPTMRANFCSECGSRLAPKGWRVRFGGRLCETCSRRLGNPWRRSFLFVSMITVAAFAFGRYLRPSPPPLIIRRTANSPLSEAPVDFNQTAGAVNRKQNNSGETIADASTSKDDPVYICGARTKKGTPCHRRVHFAGERCFQHKGMPAMVPLEKLVVKNK